MNEALFRYERKFLVDQLDAHQVRMLVKLHPALFVQPYPPRFVNNVYFDSPGLDFYHDNVRGVSDRIKVRVRWYGDLLGAIKQPTLEFKVKRGLVGAKEQYPLAPFQLAPGVSNGRLQGLLRESPLPGWAVACLHNLSAVLVNRYERWYFATRDGAYRVTVDTGLTFYRVGQLRSSLAHRQVDPVHVIVELKYGAAHEKGAGRVSGYFPFRVTKSSKYVQGIEHVFP
ncbi:MAG: polyphosphate polymerase domain-containing protein [Anaerolineae bacterium]|nr:polyphosphate polymerase domain-containing protein [Anaerolineae bacterium]